MQIREAVPIPGAQQLLEHIREHWGDIPSFCDAKGLDRLKVARALKGVILRIDVDFAFSIEEATDGQVPASSWRVNAKLLERLQRWRAGQRPKRKGKAAA